MSLSKFTLNVTKFLARPLFGNPIQSKEELSQFLTLEYDVLIRSGNQLLTGFGVLNGNTTLMEQTLNGAFNKNLNSNSTPSTILDDMGQAIISYWTGAQLIPGAPPILPSLGSINNITTTSAIVTNPGKWVTIPLPPFPDNGVNQPENNNLNATNQREVGNQNFIQNLVEGQSTTSPSQNDDSDLPSNPFVVNLVSGILLHLTTVSGIYNTISLYPSFPSPIPSPGIVPWTTYTILP